MGRIISLHHVTEHVIVGGLPCDRRITKRGRKLIAIIKSEHNHTTCEIVEVGLPILVATGAGAERKRRREGRRGSESSLGSEAAAPCGAGRPYYSSPVCAYFLY